MFLAWNKNCALISKATRDAVLIKNRPAPAINNPANANI